MFNCITVRYLNVAHLGDGVTSNNFTQAAAFWHFNQASCEGPRRAVEQVSPENLPERRMCGRGPRCLTDEAADLSPGRNRHRIHQDLITGFLDIYTVS